MSPRNTVCSVLILVSAAVGVMLLGGLSPQQTKEPAPIECVTRPQLDAQLGFPITGRVDRILVKPGDAVIKGQELIAIEDAIPKAQFELLKLRSESTLEIDAAKADWELAKLQRELVSQSFERNAATALEVERLVLEAEKARLALELFKQRHEEAKRQMVEGRERLEQFMLRAPRDGVIDRLVAEPGEVVQEQRPVLRLVDVTTLRIDAAIPTSQALDLRPGQKVSVSYPETPNVRIEAAVKSLAAVADSASNTRLVRIEFLNQSMSPAGRSVLVWLP